MGMPETPPETVPSARRADGGDAFVTAVGAALPAQGLWTMPVVVAVSGGSDSVALLTTLRRLVPPGLEHRLLVAHAEHDLRDGASADREFVVSLAARLGLHVVWRRLAIRDAPDGDGAGIEGRARRLRYAFLAEVALESGGRHVAVAHTADDQAETILHRMLRGTGLAGLGGMADARELVAGVSLVRPMLGLTREDVRGYLAAAGEAWREDPTNTDTRHARNFLRHDVIPRCEQGPYPAATAALTRLGRQASLVAGAIRSAAEHLLEVHSSRQADGSVTVRTSQFTGLDRHLVAEVFVALWRREGWPQRDMTARHYTTLAAMSGGDAGTADVIELPGRVRVRHCGDGMLSIEPAGRPSEP